MTIFGHGKQLHILFLPAVNFDDKLMNTAVICVFSPEK